jgi:hypothetical protein
MSTRAFILNDLARRQLPGLDLALLTDQGRRFAGARLSFVYLRALLRTSVHAAEVWFMARAFPLEFALPLFSMRAAFGIWGSLWWGVLEAVRRKVRALSPAQPQRARQTIEAWTCVAVGLGLSVLGLGAWYVSDNDELGWSANGLYGSYLLASALVLIADLWTRTLHAGAFALGRVYRTRWSMLAPDVLELALIVGLFRAIGPFALGAAMLITALVRSGSTLHYTRRAYRSRDLPWPRKLRLRSLGTLERSDLQHAARGLLGSIPGQLDRVLLVSLMAAGARAPELLPIAAPYYALRPVAGIAQGWARTYYVDLVRMDSLATSLFRARLERLLRHTSLVAGAAAAAALLVGGLAIFGPRGLEAAAWLVPLTLLRSHFSVLQIRAIAYARTDALMALAALVTAVAVGSFFVRGHDRALIALVTALLAVGALLAAYIQRRAARRRTSQRVRVPLGAWLAELCAQRSPVRLHVACATRRLTKPMGVMRELHKAGAAVRTTRLGATWLLWWEDGRAPLSASRLAVVLGGTCHAHAHQDAASGLEALERACAASLLPDELQAALLSDASASELPALRERFARELPLGHIVDAEHASAGLSQLPAAELQLIHRALVAESYERRNVPRRAPWQASVYAPRGEPRVAFVWPAHAPGAGAFRRSVVHAGWRDSLPRKLTPPPAAS